MNKIYIVWDKNRMITAVFDNKEKLAWFLNGDDESWDVEEYEVNNTKNMRVLNLYTLVFDLSQLELAPYSSWNESKVPIEPGHYRITRRSDDKLFVEVQADSLNEAIVRVKERES
jgi:hypothetical protein